MFKAHPLMEGHNEVQKSLSLGEMSLCHLSFLESEVPFSAQGENGLWWTRPADRKVWTHFSQLKLSELGKEDELAAGGRKCFLQKVPRDGMNLRG